MQEHEEQRREPREEPLNPGAVRRALFGLWGAILTLAILFAMYVVAENRNLRAQIDMQSARFRQIGEQAAKVEHQRQKLAACLSELVSIHEKDPEFMRIVQKHLTEAKPPAAAKPRAPGDASREAAPAGAEAQPAPAPEP